MNTDDLTQKPRTLHERIAAFNAAVLRINATLDLTTVLQEVVDSARVLTGARCGVITTLDQAGGVQDFLSSGFSAEEHTSFLTWPEGPKLWEHFRDLSGPIRLTDLPAFVRSRGLDPDLIRWKTFQGTMLRDERRKRDLMSERRRGAARGSAGFGGTWGRFRGARLSTGWPGGQPP